MKKKFLIDQAIVNSIGAAFQHASVYLEGLKDNDKRKDDLRKKLADSLRSLGSTYSQFVTEEDHCQNIVNLANTLTVSHKDAGILRNGRFRIGIAQKALNLYLKYLWCLGDIPTPLHCPLDRRIIDKLKVKSRQPRNTIGRNSTTSRNIGNSSRSVVMWPETQALRSGN